MSIRRVETNAEHTEILCDASRWDTHLLAHPEPSFLQSYAWGRLKQHFGWAPVRLRLSSGGSDPSPLAQVLFRRIPYTPYTLGYIPRGPVLNYAHEDELDSMYRALDVLARRYRAVAVTWELPESDDALLAARLARRGLRPAPNIQTRSTRVIDLAPSLDQIAAQQHHKWRYNTRVARKHGVQVRAATSLADLSRWYALYRITVQRDGFIGRGEGYFQRFWEETCATRTTVLLLAEHEGTLLAGNMVHRFGPVATYLYGASSNEGRNMMPTYLLQWEAMRWAKEQGATSYDLFGIADSDDPHEPLAGVTRFKAGFGGRVLRYAGAFDRVYHPALYALVQRLRPRAAGGAG
jgi:lipid II:glycine glycyltransferase (peptidoglycan interpeptide bridge formation enzyme)